MHWTCLVVSTSAQKLDVDVFNPLIHGLCESGNLNMAREFFHRISAEGLVPSVITYNIMINGLCRLGELKWAEELFVGMEENDCAPDVHHVQHDDAGALSSE